MLVKADTATQLAVLYGVLLKMTAPERTAWRVWEYDDVNERPAPRCNCHRCSLGLPDSWCERI